LIQINWLSHIGLIGFQAGFPVGSFLPLGSVNKKKRLILQLLDGHRVMTMATNRPDGWPQSTMVGYVNDGFLLYCFVGMQFAKARQCPA
jgi:hypothetical protein